MLGGARIITRTPSIVVKLLGESLGFPYLFRPGNSKMFVHAHSHANIKVHHAAANSVGYCIDPLQYMAEYGYCSALPERGWFAVIIDSDNLPNIAWEFASAQYQKRSGHDHVTVAQIPRYWKPNTYM